VTQLKTFLAAVRCGSVTAANDELVSWWRWADGPEAAGPA
jgi:hypothetical protein